VNVNQGREHLAGRWFGLLLVLLPLIGASAMDAAPPFLNKEQLRMLQQLSPTERENLLRFLQENKRVQQPTPVPTTNTPSLETEREQTPPPLQTPKVPRLKAGDTVLIKFQRELPADDSRRISPAEENAKKEKEEKLPEQRIFVIDQFGSIRLDGAGQILIQGLNESEAAERIQAEPEFKNVVVTVKLLPVEAPLKPFGYDLFKSTARAPVSPSDIPVPADYVIGPGDTVVVQIYGKENAERELVVSREGEIPFPGIGPIRVAGLTFSQMEREIKTRVAKRLIGISVSVTLGRLRTVRVFVLGEVERPGSYNVSGFSTMTNVLIASGGIKSIGSLRDIQLKRGGKTVGRMDLYDLLLNGDSRSDSRLLAGDAIFVPPVGARVGVAGSVRRPAIYELKSERSVGELISMAGGLTADAYLKSVQIERIRQNRERTRLDLDLTEPQNTRIEVHDGDVVTVKSVLKREEGIVTLIGHVQRPGKYSWRPNMRLSDLIPSVDVLLPQVDSGYALIRREREDDQSIELLSVNLARAMAHPGDSVDPVLRSRDEVYIFDAVSDRSSVILPLLKEARAHASPDRPIREVAIEGSVHHAGRYPLGPNMRVSDLIAAAGGLNNEAYLLSGELTRFDTVAGEAREFSREQIDVGAALRGGDVGDPILKPHDRLVVRRIPGWDVVGQVELMGEVRFPGKYPAVRGEKLSSLIKRAGGLTREAYPRGAIFVRESVRVREQEHFTRLTAQLERDLAISVAEAPGIGERKDTALAEGQALLRQMRAARATGRLVINLEDVLREGSDFDVELEDGDRLFIPKRPHEVTVLGEVYYPTAHVYNKNLQRDEYVQLSGGVTERGNKGAVYVVHADGSVTPPLGWFNSNVDVGPGDTIVVPLKVDRVSSLKVATDISQIIFQLAVAVAAFNAIGVF
jgi:polysaccharide export outer membrane protein